MESTITLNQNIVAGCLRGTYDFGGTTVRDICSGTTHFVPWGTLDWTGMCILVGFGVALLLFVFVALFRFATDWY